MEHRAQTMLYTLLMSERYKTEVPSGLLYYTQSEEVIRVPAARNEIRGLVIARNQMASYMIRRGKPRKRRTQPEGNKSSRVIPGVEDEIHEVEFEPEEPFLPPTLDDARVCGRCYALNNCMLYRRAVEEVVDTHSDIADMYALKTGHLTSSQAAFFRKWEALITMEEQDIVKFRKELWTMGAEEREERGKCFANMVLDSSYQYDPTTLRVNSNREGKIHQFTYRFVKADAEDTSLLGGHLSVGDAITVSVEPNLLAMAKGFILHLSPYDVVVGVDHVVDLDTIRQKVMSSVDPLIFRIDKDELTGGMARVRDNLAQLFYADGDRKRLELVVDLRPPIFIDFTGPMVPKTEAVAKTIADMNTNQQLAIRKVLSAQDYSLILGMPGTGKTTVIAAIIRVLVARGKTVLLTSYTHSAVDTILRKLKPDADFGILRIGNVDKVIISIRKEYMTVMLTMHLDSS